MTRSTQIVSAAAVIVSLLAAPMAMAADSIDAALKDKVTKQMTADGYEVRKIQMEDGMIEVYAVKDGKTLEVYLDKDLKIVKTIKG